MVFITDITRVVHLVDLTQIINKKCIRTKSLNVFLFIPGSRDMGGSKSAACQFRRHSGPGRSRAGCGG